MAARYRVVGPMITDPVSSPVGHKVLQARGRVFEVDPDAQTSSVSISPPGIGGPATWRRQSSAWPPYWLGNVNEAVL